MDAVLNCIIVIAVYRLKIGFSFFGALQVAHYHSSECQRASPRTMVLHSCSVLVTMVNFCVVPGCSKRSNREKDLSYYRLPLKDKKLLQIWIYKIGRKNLPLNGNSRVCSEHFEPNSARGRCLLPGEYPTLKLPEITKAEKQRRPPPTKRVTVPLHENHNSDHEEQRGMEQLTVKSHDIEVQVDLHVDDTRIVNLEAEIEALKLKLHTSALRLSNICNSDSKIQFYTGFHNYCTLMALYKLLGPAVNCLNYWGSEIKGDTKSIQGRHRSLTPTEEFFMVLVRLKLGLFEQDLAYRFGISVSTVSRICITWISFLYVKLKELPLWPCRDMVQANMPQSFKKLYPSTRVIIDCTEIFVDMPSLPLIQQMTFSSYKNHNTYKVLIGISPGGAVTFVSKLFPGAISDKQLTLKSGLLKLLERGDSVMADRGFDIQDQLTPLGVRLNIPAFSKGKVQFSNEELIETRRIATLRIHVERAMERIKNYHILDRNIPHSLNNIAEQIVTVCAILTNFMPPFCE